MSDLGDICLRSPSLNGINAVEIKIPVRSLARELEEQIPLASAYKDLPKGRKRAGWRKDFLRSIQKAAADLGDISEKEILKTVREYRSRRKKLPEITVVARTNKKTAECERYECTRLAIAPIERGLGRALVGRCKRELAFGVRI
jgi:hypothetical protein